MTRVIRYTVPIFSWLGWLRSLFWTAREEETSGREAGEACGGQEETTARAWVNQKAEEGSSQAAQYIAYVDFTADETVRLGMTVVVYVH